MHLDTFSVHVARCHGVKLFEQQPVQTEEAVIFALCASLHAVA